MADRLSGVIFAMLSATLGACSSPAEAQVAGPQFPAPIDGQYRCHTWGNGFGSQMTFDPEGTVAGAFGAVTINKLKFDYMAPQLELRPSIALGRLTLAGGKYTLAGGAIKGSGTVSWDAKARQPRFTGPLASIPHGYYVTSSGSYELFFNIVRSGSSDYCAKTVPGNPLPVIARPNGPVMGSAVLSQESKIYRIDFASGQMKQIGPGAEASVNAKGQMVYMSTENAVPVIVFVQPDGTIYGRIKLEIAEAFSSKAPALSPDGRSVAYHGTCLNDLGGFFTSSSCIAVKSVDGRLLYKDFDGDPVGSGIAWKPDGQLIYGRRDGSFVLVGGNGAPRVAAQQSVTPAVSRDGQFVAYGAKVGIFVSPTIGKGRLVFDVNSEAGRDVLAGVTPNYLLSLSWSPDGQYLLAAYNNGHGPSAWMLIPLDGRPAYTPRNQYGEPIKPAYNAVASW